jgi:hypothetical protein
MILAHIAASLLLPSGFALLVFGDTIQFLLISLAAAVMMANAVSNRGNTRIFWSLMAAGCLLWAANQSLWLLYEVILRREIPAPFIGDVILFIHVVPFMAAVALQPHRPQDQHKLQFSTLNFLMLLIWWVFLYAFILFPNEYVSFNGFIYSRNYDLLYLVENLMLLGALGALACNSRGLWKKAYWNLFLAFALYTFSSEAMNAAIAR